MFKLLLISQKWIKKKARKPTTIVTTRIIPTTTNIIISEASPEVEAEILNQKIQSLFNQKSSRRRFLFQF